MKPGEILEQLFDKKMLHILKLFIDNAGKEFGVREVSKHTRVPLATAFRILDRLCSAGIIRHRKIKTLKLYSVEQNESTDYIATVLAAKKSALDEFVKRSSAILGVEQIILHGKEEKNKASILIIGRGVNPEIMRSLVVEIKAGYDFNIIYLTLEPDQFEQMASMGLYPGKKMVLFSKQA